ncbi:MAG TPA: glucose-6-phosphate dehydrogenase, partial [Rhabdochlamydiaceae bacterium]
AVGYRQEPDVNPQSNIETYLALKIEIENARWSGVPFYIRAGKRLPKKTTEVAVIFKDLPLSLFQNGNRKNPPNILVIRIQPDEGSSLKINCKVPGPTNVLQPVKMDFRYGSYFGTAPPEAYERLICDCIVGDSTLFAREDEVFNSWKLLTPLLDNWAKNPPKDFPNYPAGSWGPKAADQLIEADGRKWRLS